MAIVRSRSGKVYDVPDDELSKYEVPSDLLQAIGMRGAAPEAGEGESGDGDVDPYGFGVYFGWGGGRRRWRNRWHNCWRNCWRNCY